MSNKDQARRLVGKPLFLKARKEHVQRFRDAGATLGRVKIDEIVRFEISKPSRQPFYTLQLMDGGTDRVEIDIRTDADLASWELLSVHLDELDAVPEEKPGSYFSDILKAGPEHFGDEAVFDMAYCLAAEADGEDAEFLTIFEVAEIIHRDIQKDQMENKTGLLKTKLRELGLEFEFQRVDYKNLRDVVSYRMAL